MAPHISRREALGCSILISAASLGFVVQAKNQLDRFTNPIEIAELSVLKEEWDQVIFKLPYEEALLIRIPKPSEEALKSERILKTGDSYLTAYTLTCTHEGCTVFANKPQRELSCGCHGSKFQIQDGAVLAGPANSPLKGIKLVVQNNKVFAIGTLS